MRKNRIIIPFCLGAITIWFLASCNSQVDECDASIYCHPTPIDSNWVNLQISERTFGVPVILYRGNIEDNQIVLRDTLYSNEISYYLPTDRTYTAEAYYQVGPNLIIAVDSDELEEDTFQNCGETCYQSDEITLDLVLID